MNIHKILKDRVLVLDGAMGTQIQKYNLDENDYRGERFVNFDKQLFGINDVLVLTKPEIITEIHSQYLESGADIIETNTFNATSVSLEEYGLENYVYEINYNAAKLAKSIAEQYNKSNPNKPRFVAGVLGPTNKTTTISPEVSDPAYRAINFDQLKNSYYEQVNALIEGGVDIILIETIFDTLNAKAAISAVNECFENKNIKLPIMLSLTVADTSGRTLSGQTIEAFLASVMHSDIFSIGFNCSFGANEIKPFLKLLSDKAPYFISCHPNAGLPTRFGKYDQTPEIMAEFVKECLDEKLVNIIGGCCGTTPEHNKGIAKLAETDDIYVFSD